MPQHKPNNSSLKEQLNELQSEEIQGMLLHKHNNKPVITIIGKHAKEQFDKALDLAFNVPTLVDNEPNSEDLHKNSSDDSKAQSVLAEVQQSLHNNKETTFTIKNPYAPIEPIEEAEYYKQNAEYYLKEYQLIQQKQSKLSSTKRRQIVHIVETYLLT